MQYYHIYLCKAHFLPHFGVQKILKESLTKRRVRTYMLVNFCQQQQLDGTSYCPAMGGIIVVTISWQIM